MRQSRGLQPGPWWHPLSHTVPVLPNLLWGNNGIASDLGVDLTCVLKDALGQNHSHDK